MPPRPQRFWSPDIFRGVCSLTVFINHWVLWSNFSPQGIVETRLHSVLMNIYYGFVALAWPTGGQHPALIGFFILSGFCVHYPFEVRGRGSAEHPSWRDYLTRRARRILPVYWIGSVLGLVVVAAMAGHWVADPLLQLHTNVSIEQIVVRFGVLNGVWPHEIFAGNYILNTVGVEALIYLLYPLFFRQVRAGRWYQIGVVALMMQFVALALQPFFDPFVLFASLLVMAPFWYFGALVAHLWITRKWQVRGWWIGAAWSAFLGMSMIPPFYGRNTIRQGVWAVVCALLVGWLVSWEGRNESKRAAAPSRLFQWFGEISYSLYATHTPVILLVNWVFITAGRFSYAWQLAINFVLPMAVTVAVHQWVEKRFYAPQAIAPAGRI